MNIEENLRSALRREEPSSDFAARVLAEAGKLDRVTPIPISNAMPAPKPSPAVLLSRSSVYALAASLLAVSVVPAAYYYQQREMERRAAMAGEQLRLALAITHDQLQQTRELIAHKTRHDQ